jgi:glycosyltransferase involved in cell wall biosynthesis
MNEISIIVPVYNEEAVLYKNSKKILSLMDSTGLSYELIIASNGSSDRTASIARKLSRESRKIKTVFLNEKGVGAAFLRAFEKSTGRFILSLDIDLSIDMSFVKKALALSRKYDIVIGSKITGKQNRSFLRKIPSAIFIGLVRMILRMKYNDYSMAAKLYKRKCISRNIKLVGNGSSYVINLIYASKKQGMKIIEVPISCTDFRRSRFNIVRESIYRFCELIKLAFFTKI